MFRATLTIALRKLWTDKVFSVVNIAGLALGMATFLLILEYVSFERSVNAFHTNLPTLYRLTGQNEDGDTYTDLAPAVAPLAKQQFPDVRDYCRIAEHSANGIIAIDRKNGPPQPFREEKLVYADASFFSLFTFPLVQGNAGSALAEPSTVALSATKARTYFGTEKAVGQSLMLYNRFGKMRYTVTAVYADMPTNSDLRFDAIFALQTLANPANLNGNDWARLDGFDGNYLTTFLQLTNAQTDPRALEAKFNAFKQQANPNDKSRLLLQPAGNLHLAQRLSDPYPTGGSLGFVYLLSALATLIVFIAWFNYVNLSTAGALKRGKEVGVRKVIGAGRRQLVGQFLGESLLVNGLGFGLALLLVVVVQDSYNQFVRINLSLAVLRSDPFWLAGVGLLLTGALASGAYVAGTLTAFKPVQTLKGWLPTSRGAWLRKGLVVAQFSASVALIAATFVLYRQLTYMQNKALGVRLDQRLVIQRPSVGDDAQLAARQALFEQQLVQRPYVQRLCQGNTPGNPLDFTTNGIVRKQQGNGAPIRPDDAKKGYAMLVIDERYLPTYEIALVAGRNFSAREAELAWEKSQKVLVNETAARQLGFISAAEAAGQPISWGGTFEVVGVVKDYHHQGLQQLIEPTIYLPRRAVADLTVQLTTDQIGRKLAEIEQRYKAAFPGNPFVFAFVDERYNQQYQREQQYWQVFTVASALAILIACLGLFGLATFMAEQRTKEIGVRKVLGASISSIVTLLSKDFVQLVLIAIVIASPLAWWATNRWLQGFAYKVEVEWWVFAGAGTLAIAVALLTVSFQSVRAALLNPANSLRAE
ncbi:protein of unknown function DUF214 [Fibrella aestuarina BUZ 2]|uniref:Macrolide export ATP-binding/permease protein macB n=1 Tax=Fibrella aestuarina BUZ 2 TaxID=1166018 RepID=I0K270_9BACT|nr:ABC transporter permease [Fibrella aestuarina]CCG98223.1 protein of unknown function DUF214 [Fibrella aestuarina BUZ 2]